MPRVGERHWVEVVNSLSARRTRAGGMSRQQRLPHLGLDQHHASLGGGSGGQSRGRQTSRQEAQRRGWRGLGTCTRGSGR